MGIGEVATMRTIGRMLVAVGAVALMAAPSWAQGPRGGFGGMGGAGLLRNKGVQKELKVSDEQATKLDAFAEEMMEKNRERFQGLRDLSDDERREKMQELNKTIQSELHKGLADVLKPEQMKRFDQIQVQAAGVNAFGTPRVQKALKLTDEEKSKIKEITDETMQAVRSAFEDAGDDRQAAMAKITEVRKAAFAKAEALLSEEQKKEWKELTGAPYEVKFEPRPPR